VAGTDPPDAQSGKSRSSAQISAKNLQIASCELSGLNQATRTGPGPCGLLDLLLSRAVWRGWKIPESASLLALSLTAYLSAVGLGEMHSSAAGPLTDGFLWVNKNRVISTGNVVFRKGDRKS